MSKTTWSHAQENFPQNELFPQNKVKKKAHEIYTDNSQTQKSTQPPVTIQEPIIVNDNGAMNIDDQQPTSKNNPNKEKGETGYSYKENDAQ
jgi:hypothetical protein